MERAIPTFPCRDLDSASAFYQSLGFHLGARYPTYAILQRGALELHLSLFEALEPKTNCSAAYLRLEDAQALHRQATALGLGGQDSTHHGPGRPALGHARIRPDRSRWQPAAGRPGARCDARAAPGSPGQRRRRPRSGRALASQCPRSRGNPGCRRPTGDPGTAPGRLAQPLALAGGGPAASPRFRPRPLVADRGRSGTGRRSQSSTYCRRPAARAWPGNWWAAPRRPCSRGAGLIRAQSALTRRCPTCSGRAWAGTPTT